MAVHAAGHGWPDYAALISKQLYRYLLGSSNSDAMIVHSHARDAARRVGDREAEAASLRHLAVTLSQLGLFEPAREHLEEALALFEDAGDVDGQARTREAGQLRGGRGAPDRRVDRVP
jgi:hypothetical protein